MDRIEIIKKYRRRVIKKGRSCLRICIPAELSRELGLSNDNDVLLYRLSNDNKFVVEIIDRKKELKEIGEIENEE